MRGIGTTISGMMGRGSIRHNNREFTAANVDRNRSGQNIVFVNEDLKQVYHELFDEALESYNAGKKKTRDKIPDYYEHIRQSKQEKLFHEAIFQIGNLSDCGCGSEGGQRAAEALTEFAKTFQERNPHLRVFNMVLHMDEATPHLHVDYIPVATEQTRGLSVRVSIYFRQEHPRDHEDHSRCGRPVLLRRREPQRRHGRRPSRVQETFTR